MKPLFISISGKKQTGKDQFATFLKEQLQELGKLVTITHFADPLKEMCIQLFGLDSKLVYGNNADKETLTDLKWDGFPHEVRMKYATKSTPQAFDVCGETEMVHIKTARTGPMTVREVLQVMGTDIFRERVYQNIWAELPFKQKWEHERPYSPTRYEVSPMDFVLISDCRFPNEVEETLKHNGLIIRVNRDTGNTDQHPSETALDNYNWMQERHTLIYNNRTLNDLRLQAALVADRISGISH
jgi:hypothetical protein